MFKPMKTKSHGNRQTVEGAAGSFLTKKNLVRIKNEKGRNI